MFMDDQELPFDLNPEFIQYDPSYDHEHNDIFTTEPHSIHFSDTTSVSQSIDHTVSESEETPQYVIPSDACILPEVAIKIIDSIAIENPKNTQLKKKITKAKNRATNLDGITFDKEPQTKKQRQMMKNRVAAQESRNKKKKEFDDLKSENDRLKIENDILRQQLLHKQTQINSIFEVVDRLSAESRTEFEAKRKGITSNAIRRPFPIFKLPVIMSALMLGVICFGCFFGVYSKSLATERVSIEMVGREMKMIEYESSALSNSMASDEHIVIVANGTVVRYLAEYLDSNGQVSYVVCKKCSDSDIGIAP